MGQKSHEIKALAGAAVLAALVGCADPCLEGGPCARPGAAGDAKPASQRQPEVKNMTTAQQAPARAVPPIDAAAPAKIETATFALG